ncbi:MAG: efflux RND transporter permease subunit, partial [Gammaproteobacteria bacterium]
MLDRLIDVCVRYPIVVLIVTAVVAVAGAYAVVQTPKDAIPDLSDVQVIVYTEYPEQAPQIVEAQVTYPLTTALRGVSGAKAVRGYSLFGVSFVYVIFADGTDPYWARSRVLEYLNQATRRLPKGVVPTLGPDASGVGWVYQYALVDKSGQHDLAGLRSLQDWYLRYELQAVPGVAEVASVGGFVRQYQVEIDPVRLAAHGIRIEQVRQAIARSNNDVGGRVIELAETEFMVRGLGYIRSVADIESIAVVADARGVPVRIADLGRVTIGPEARRGIAELNGEGEVVGGIVVMQNRQNAQAVIRAVKQRLAELTPGLPAGVEIITVYDRSTLIDRAITTLSRTLIEEMIVVALVCALFLWNVRSLAVALVVLPLGILISFAVMYLQGINASIMSLGGIAIAIGAMVDAAIVMIENAHKRLERDGERRPAREVVLAAAKQLGPPLFFGLLIVTVSFLPVFTLEAQEGRLFAPLAYTKTYAMAGAALLSVTLVPVLMVYFIRGRVRPERDIPVNRFLQDRYRRLIDAVLSRKRATLVVAGVVMLITLWPATRLGSEFMPALNEGDLLYMPTTFPEVSTTKIKEILQQSDRIIRRFPEVESVFGKAGRADTATDPAPLMMLETTIQLKDKSEWRAGMTLEKLIDELDRAVRFPGVANTWTMPIRARIDM